MSLSLRKISAFTLRLGEALGYLALFLSPEVSRLALVAVPLATGFLYSLGLRLGNRVLLLAVGGVVVAGLLAGYFQPVSIAISTALLALHGLLWLPKAPSEYRYWRLGIAFLEIILASILAPETHMFLLIFLFAIVSSLALSFGFVERRFGQQKAPRVSLQLLWAIFALTGVIFLSSLLIFPILPRSNSTGLGREWAEPGYAESVDFRSTISWAAGSSRPLIWIFRPEDLEWPEILPHGLLRVAVLDIFNGESWKAGARQYSPPLPGGERKMEIFRDALNSNYLPVPYGAIKVELAGREQKHFSSGEWPAAWLRNRRVGYQVWFGEADISDPPKLVHREIPSVSPTIAKLAASWSNRGESDAEKIAKVKEYFSGFRWNLVPMSGVEAGKPHPVETFLSRTREGHCELFATAAALLFRSMGMPSRLVAGFRVGKGGDVIVARNTDAHAWVEVWVNGKGWVPFDPSPVALQEQEFFFDFYGTLSAYWYRYIVGYEFDGRALWRELRQPFVLGALLALAALWFGHKMWRRRSASRFSPRHPVTKTWERIERKIGHELERPQAEKLKNFYLELRFGPKIPEKEDLARLRQMAADLDRSSGAG